MSDTPEGVVMLYIDVRIHPHEMADWPVGCIKAFFAGLAQMEEAVHLARRSIRERESADCYTGSHWPRTTRT